MKKALVATALFLATVGTAVAGTYECDIPGAQGFKVDITANSQSEAKDIYWDALMSSQARRLVEVSGTTKSDVICRSK